MSDERTRRYLETLTFEWDDIDFSATDQARKSAPPPVQKPYEADRSIVRLPPVDSLERPRLSVVDAILGRKSHRKFTDGSLSTEELSLLLYCTQGMRFHNEKYSLRTVPSGGARHAFETYLYLERVTGIASGLYRYLPIEHALILERETDADMKRELNAALNDMLYGAAAYFLWTAIPYRSEWRYSFAAPKLIALDAGHVCENLYLVCEAIGCGTCAIGAYSQERMNAFLGVDGREEFAVYMAPVGKVGPED
jgi:SagB-type dehydrogenase family enzyme